MTKTVRGDRMAGLLLRIRLFLSSYAPLFFILAIRWFPAPRLWVSSLGLGVLGVLNIWLILRAARKIQPDPHRITHVADHGAEVAGYLVTYLLPFVTVSVPSTRDILGYAVFMLVVAVVYVQSEMIQINPFLYLLGYKVSAVTTEDGWSGFLVTRRQPRPGAVVLASRLQETLALERNSRRDDHKVAPRSRDDSRR